MSLLYLAGKRHRRFLLPAGLNFDDNVTIVGTATGLSDKLSLTPRRPGNGFAIRYPRPTHICRHPKIPEDAPLDDLQVQFTHARDHHLTGFLIDPPLKGGVLLGHLAQCLSQFIPFSCALGLDGHGNHRLGEVYGL